jgi:hypothetical protein
MTRQYYDKKFDVHRAITARCPRCEALHEVFDIYWTGRGIPRIFCGHCNRAATGEFIRKGLTIKEKENE